MRGSCSGFLVKLRFGVKTGNDNGRLCRGLRSDLAVLPLAALCFMYVGSPHSTPTEPRQTQVGKTRRDENRNSAVRGLVLKVCG